MRQNTTECFEIYFCENSCKIERVYLIQADIKGCISPSFIPNEVSIVEEAPFTSCIVGILEISFFFQVVVVKRNLNKH